MLSMSGAQGIQLCYLIESSIDALQVSDLTVEKSGARRTKFLSSAVNSNWRAGMELKPK